MAIGRLSLVDKSALAQAHHPEARGRLEKLALNGLLATCSMIDLEIGFSARVASEHSTLIAQRRPLPRLPISQVTFDRALEVQSHLAKGGHHRVSLPDLIIAACAEEHGAVVIHYDKDFDAIAQVTGQSTRWIAPRGSLL